MERIMNTLERVKALSVRQPWASAIVYGGKNIENRSWSTKYRGPLLIHAGATRCRDEEEDAEEFIIRIIGKVWKFLPNQYGGIIGVVDLVDVVESSSSPWFVGPFGWVLENPRPLPFVPMKGRLGLFDVQLGGVGSTKCPKCNGLRYLPSMGLCRVCVPCECVQEVES